MYIPIVKDCAFLVKRTFFNYTGVSFMKIIVTHHSPDWDAITSCWLLKRFLPGWENAEVKFVPAGERLRGSALAGPATRSSHGAPASFADAANADALRGSPTLVSPADAIPSTTATPYSLSPRSTGSPVEQIGDNEVIHVDTGLGPLDHHETDDQSVCAASRTWEYVSNQQSVVANQGEKWKDKKKAIERIVAIVTEIDHFKEVFWENPTADYHEFSLLGLLEGYKLQYPDHNEETTLFGCICLDAMLRDFENRVWAEKEIEEKGILFETRFGKGLGIETINDAVLKLAQKMGYVIVVRKDPRKGYVRIKAKPLFKSQIANRKSQNKDIDLTNVCEELKKRDLNATWFLHVSKKMLLNGTTKNPAMVPTALTLSELIDVAKKI